MRFLTVILLILLLLTACASDDATTGPSLAVRRTIRLMTHDSFAVSEEVIAEFEAANNARVEILPSGDTGAALSQAILSKGNPLADVFFGIDNTFLGRALEADIFQAYQSPGLADIPDEFELDPEHRLLPVDYGDVCLNYDKAWFAEKELAPPTSLEDLTQSAYNGLLVVENPATSSPGLAFMLATIANLGEDAWLDYWQALRANDVLVTSDWEQAYWGEASWTEGQRPLVVSYATSPAAEVYFSEGDLQEPPTGNVLGPGTCFRQIEFVGILKDAKNRDLAEKLVDFMLGQRFQEDIPLQMFVFPANAQASLPDFYEWAQQPDQPAKLDPADIQANRERWIEKWTQTVLR